MAFGNMGNMWEAMKQAKKLKDEMSKARYSAEAGGVRAVVNGEMEIMDLEIPPEIELKKISSSVKDAVNRALKSAKTDMASKLQGLTGGMSLPGMP